MMNSNLFHKLWLHNGKCMTVYSYIYLIAAMGCFYSGDMVSTMLAIVLAEINRVDKEARVLTVEQAGAILYEGDHPEEFKDKDDE